MNINIHIENANNLPNEEPIMQKTTTLLNQLVGSPFTSKNPNCFFVADEENKRIDFKTCSNSVLHGKLLGLIFLYFSKNAIDGFVGIYPPAGYIFLRTDASIYRFYNFIKNFSSMSETQINFH